MRNSIARVNHLNSSQPSAKYFNEARHQATSGVLTTKRQGQTAGLQGASQVARKHERIIFLKGNIVTEWNQKKYSKDHHGAMGYRNKSHNNTLNPKDTHPDHMIDTTQVEITDGRSTANVNEVYPEGRTLANSSMHDSWAMTKSHHSPFISSSVKKRKRPQHEDVKSKISSYRRKYYDQVYNINEGSITDGDKMEMTVTTRNSGFQIKTAARGKKGTRVGPY